MASVNIRGHQIKYVNQSEFFKVVEQGSWESSTFDVIDRYVEVGKSFIDIGAWCGVLSMYAASLGAKVYSIEPDGVSFRELSENMTANKYLQKNKVDNIAISDKDGMGILNSMDNAFGNSESSLVIRNTVNGEVSVPTKTIGAYIASNEISDICLIKIDIEGGEHLLINYETLTTLKRHDYPPIYISFHPAWIPDINSMILNFTPFLDVYKITSEVTGLVNNIQDFEIAMQTGNDNVFLLTRKN